MKLDFLHTKSTVTKVTDATLDDIITNFLLTKINLILNARQKNRGDYDGWEYKSRCMNDWDSVGETYYFEVITKSPNQIKNTDDIEMLNTSEILNWMCSEGVIDDGDYLVKVVQNI